MRLRGGRLLLIALALVWACVDSPRDPDEIPLRVAQRCPGDAGCPNGADARLYAGAAVRDVTPAIETFADVDGNEKWDPGEPFDDRNGNGVYDAYYIAGFGNDRRATGVHDPIWARVWVLRQNDTTVAFFSLDAVGLFKPDIDAVRGLIDPALGVDLVIGSATHCHQAPDTLGQWGPDLVTRGVNDAWMAGVRQKIADAIAEAVSKLAPARLTAGSIRVEDPDGGVKRYLSDTRDPVVMDTRLHILKLDALADGKPIVAVVNWAAHPEAAGSKNQAISSDFVHYLREDVEAALGAPVVYHSGALGGQVGPGRVEPLGPDGQPIADWGFPFIEAWGRSIARFALRALDPAQGGDVIVDEAPRLSFRTTRFPVHIENSAFILAATRFQLFQRETFGWNEKKGYGEGNYPMTETEEAYVQIGPTSLITIPGELHPELFIGGYDGAFAYGAPVVDLMQANAADLARAPAPPYLRDLMDGPVEHRMLFGLSMDFFGYVIPRFNFVVDETLPYLFEAEGDHYEETNSLGPRGDPELVGTARQLIQAGDRRYPSNFSRLR
jgi:hypothetical protein